MKRKLKMSYLAVTLTILIMGFLSVPIVIGSSQEEENEDRTRCIITFSGAGTKESYWEESSESYIYTYSYSSTYYSEGSIELEMTHNGNYWTVAKVIDISANQLFETTTDSTFLEFLHDGYTRYSWEHRETWIEIDEIVPNSLEWNSTVHRFLNFFWIYRSSEDWILMTAHQSISLKMTEHIYERGYTPFIGEFEDYRIEEDMWTSIIIGGAISLHSEASIFLTKQNGFYRAEYEDLDGYSWVIMVEMEKEECQSMIRPVEGVITSLFGMRYHKLLQKMRFHWGIDIGRVGGIMGTPILAAADGVVDKIGWEDQGAGNYINIRHKNIIRLDGLIVEDVVTKYFHMKEPSFLKKGQNVKQGDIIGFVGNTGFKNMGAHLHFEVVEWGRRVNPELYVEYEWSKKLRAQAKCPVDMVLVDPDGLIVSNETIEIEDVASYFEDDFDGDGELDKQIGITERKNGIYKLYIYPEPNALPTDTFSLEISTEDINLILAENVLISDITTQPYAILSSESGIEPIIPATIDLDPDTLNLKSKGNWITAYIEFPEGYSVLDIVISSVELKDGSNLITSSPWGDIQGSILMVKFSRSDVIEYLKAREGEFEDIVFTLTGLINGELFGGSDTMRIINQ